MEALLVLYKLYLSDFNTIILFLFSWLMSEYSLKIEGRLLKLAAWDFTALSEVGNIFGLAYVRSVALCSFLGEDSFEASKFYFFDKGLRDNRLELLKAPFPKSAFNVFCVLFSSILMLGIFV